LLLFLLSSFFSPLAEKEVANTKVANAPTIQWQKTIGDNDTATINNAQQTTDGGYILAGYKNDAQTI
jgi:hypothetical protein